jgi:site-specific recombinase XerD
MNPVTVPHEGEASSTVLQFPAERKTAQNGKRKTAQNEFVPPRGIRLVTLANRPRPYGVSWRVEGRQKWKSFRTVEAQIQFARGMAGELRAGGVAALRLDPDEARAWRAFRADLGNASLADVLACWKRFGGVSGVTLGPAIAAFTKAKEAEGVSPHSLAHWRPVFSRLLAALGDVPAAHVTRDQIGDWLAALPFAPLSKRTHLIRVRQLFRWLQQTRQVGLSPCDGLRAPKIVAEPVAILTVEQCRSLFAKCEELGKRELAGRLALEAFAGLRFSSAEKVVAEDIKTKERGLVLPAAKIKTQRRQFIDGLPANLWAWLAWAKPEAWAMSPRDYMREKSAIFVAAGVPHPRNCLRHSFATYHVAAHADVSRTATILCHSSPTMLFRHYRGNATAAAGRAWFKILPARNSA